MVDLKNIKDYMARAAVLRNKLSQIKGIKERYAMFTYLFPTLEDKMVCKALFDMLYTSDIVSRKFISQMIDGMNKLVPQKLSEMVDVYNQVCVFAQKKLAKNNIIASDDGGIRDIVEEKQGSLSSDEKYGRASDPFVVTSNIDPNRENVNDDGNKKKKKKKSVKVEKITNEEVILAKKEVEDANKRKKEKISAEELRKRAEYEKSLKERSQKKAYGKIAESVERVLDSRY